MRLGIVGLPNVGKSTLFNAITRAGAAVANYPFCTIEPNVGSVAVPDDRLAGLAAMYHPLKVVPATVDFVDIAGLVRGASKGEGLGNQFLSNIRGVDALIHVVRLFSDSQVTHVDGAPDPLRDIETIRLELILADLEYIDRRLDKLRKISKDGDRKKLRDVDACERIRAVLSEGGSARLTELDEDQQDIWKDLDLLSAKPELYVANVDETDLPDGPTELMRRIRAVAAGSDAVIAISARIEEEIGSLDPSEQAAFLADLGLAEAGLNTVIRAGYRLLGQISFLTAGAPEVRAWTVRQGTRAPQAAGKIHSDIERGFIRAEVIGYDELITAGSHAAAREHGLIRSEGKEYIIRDGDVILFRFNV